MAIIYVTPRTPGGINGGIAQAKSGDVILVKNGVYRSFLIDKNNILIIAVGKKVIIDGRLLPLPPGDQVPESSQVRAFVGASDLQVNNVTQPGSLQGVEVRGFTVFYGSAHFSSADNCRIINNRIIHSPGNGINLLNCSGFLVWGNRICEANGNGIDVTGPSNWILCNYIADCTGNGIQIGSSNNAVINNTVENNQGSGISVNGMNNLIYKNKLRHNDVGPGPVDTGIIVSDDQNKIVGTDIIDDLSDGLILNGDGNYSANDWIMGSDGDGVVIGGNNNVLERDWIVGSDGSGAVLDGCFNSMIDCIVGGNGDDNIVNNCPSNNFYGNRFFLNPND